MSKVGQWVFEMQEDAAWMSREVFIRVHGIQNVDVFDKLHSMEDEYEPDLEGYEAMMEGYHG